MRVRKKPIHQPVPDRSFVARWRAWYVGKRLVFWFCAKFGCLMLLYFGASTTMLFHQAIGGYLAVMARVAGVILNAIGEPSRVTGATIWSANTTISVLPLCSALEFACFFCAAVTAFPAPLGCKIGGILLGVPLLLALNLARIVSLYYVGAHYQGFFNAVHEQVWPTLFILATILICSGWIRWVRGDEPIKTDVSA